MDGKSCSVKYVVGFVNGTAGRQHDGSGHCTFEEGLRRISSSECGGGGLRGGEDCFDSFEGQFPSVEGIARSKTVRSFHLCAGEGGVDVVVVVMTDVSKFANFR
jgi:hypothetical protein